MPELRIVGDMGKEEMNRIQLRFLKAADNQREKLTEYEIKFLDNMLKQGSEYQLSDPQNKILNQIHRKTNDG